MSENKYEPGRENSSVRTTEQYIKTNAPQGEAHNAAQTEPVRHRRSDRRAGINNNVSDAPDRVYQRSAASASTQAPAGATTRFDSLNNNNTARPAEASWRTTPARTEATPVEEDTGRNTLPPVYDGGGDYMPPVWPKVLIGVLLTLIIAAAAIFFIFVPGSNISDKFRSLTGGTTAPTAAPEEQASPRDDVSNVSIICPAGNNENASTAQPLEFTIKTGLQVTAVRLVYEQTGEVIGTYYNGVDGTWDEKVYLADTYDGYFKVQIFNDQSTEAIDTSARIRVIVAVAVTTQEPVPQETLIPVTAVPATDTPAPVPTETPAPVATETAQAAFVPVANATIEPTPSPVPEMTEEPTPAPTEMITPAPTAEPTPVPTPEPTATPEPTPVPDPTATPMPIYTASPASSTLPSVMKVAQTVYKGSKKQTDFSREAPLNAPDPDRYIYADNGVFTFRGDNFRRNASWGTVEISSGTMEILWQKDLGSIKTSDTTLYGVGWGTQAAIVKWPAEVRQMMNLYDAKKEKNALKEVIFAAQDGKVYFLDLTTGEQTRDCITIGFPLKGSVTVDPNSRPMIAFGQAISKLSNKTGNIGYYVYSLVDESQLLFINGRSSDNQKQYSSNGAFDGTGLFLGPDSGDALLIAGENGLFYTVKLNTTFDYLNKKELSISAETLYLQSKAGAAKDNRTGIEGSLAMYDKYAYMADTYGMMRCVDTNTMSIVWSFDCGDNTDASPALDFDKNGNLALYTGTGCYERLKSSKKCILRRLNALTGEEEWSYEVACTYDSAELGGCKASPVVGENAIEDLVIFTVNMTGNGKTSTVIALNKQTGKCVWSKELSSTAISSPVAVYNALGNAWIIQADESGILHLLDGVTGTEISTLDLGGKIQASPAVYKDILVIGTCSKGNARMYGIKLN